MNPNHVILVKNTAILASNLNIRSVTPIEIGWVIKGKEKQKEKISDKVNRSIISSDGSLIKILALEASDQDFLSSEFRN